MNSELSEDLISICLYYCMGLELSNVLASLGMVSASDHTSVVSMNLFVALLCACIVIGHLLEEYRWINESITALAIVSWYMHAFYLMVFSEHQWGEFEFGILLFTGSVYRSCYSANYRRKKFSPFSLQRRSFLYLSSTTHYFQCWVSWLTLWLTLT